MRTQEQRWIFKNRIVNFVSGKRRYDVQGIITFVFSPGNTLFSIRNFREAILDADKMFPWKDDIHPDVKHESIFYLGDGQSEIQSGVITSCWFSIAPRWSNLRQGQAYAYEKYLAKLAEEVAKKKFRYVVEVRSVIEVRAVTSFRTK